MSMQDGSIDKSEYDPRRGQTVILDDYDKNSLNSIPRNAEMHNGGFPISGPGDDIHSKHKSNHGKKKKKKSRDLRPSTTQQFTNGAGLNDYAYGQDDVVGDYSENGSSHYSQSLSARDRKRKQIPAPNLGERNKSVGSNNTPNPQPFGGMAQIAQPRYGDNSNTRLSDPGDFTMD